MLLSCQHRTRRARPDWRSRRRGKSAEQNEGGSPPFLRKAGKSGLAGRSGQLVAAESLNLSGCNQTSFHPSRTLNPSTPSHQTACPRQPTPTANHQNSSQVVDTGPLRDIWRPSPRPFAPNPASPAWPHPPAPRFACIRFCAALRRVASRHPETDDASIFEPSISLARATNATLPPRTHPHPSGRPPLILPPPLSPPALAADALLCTLFFSHPDASVITSANTRSTLLLPFHVAPLVNHMLWKIKI